MTGKLARSQRSPPRGSSGRGRSLLKVGDLLASKYRVARVLGEGGMGVVVEAYHELLDQRVAVKLLYQDGADREAQSRLLLEARAAAKLQSDHVARVIDVDVGADGLPFIIMELLEGSDLCEIADARGALPRWLVVDYMLQALEGLAHAHGHGIIHRDLKPSNLFLANRPDGSQIIKILDFGISKSQGPVDRRERQLTGGMTVLGSPPYMSPEQVRSPKLVDHRTDIWSLGISMYELLTNAMPFGGEEVQETFANILELEPVPIRSLVTGVPEGLERVVARCVAKNRDDRFADVGELAKALVPFGSGSWMQSAERIQATLIRTRQEAASLPRVSVTTGSSSIPVPSSRRLDSLQPELHGTASTVGHRFTVLESKKRMILGLCAVMMTAGIVLISTTLVRTGAANLPFLHHSPPLPEFGVGLAASASPAATVTDAVPAAAPTGVATASVENDLPTSPLPQATVIGASPMPLSPMPLSPMPGSPMPGSPAVLPPGSSVGTKLRQAAPPPIHHVTRPPPPPPAPASATKGGLPPGLPQTRSGQ